LSVRQVIQLPKEVVLFGRAFEKPFFFFFCANLVKLDTPFWTLLFFFFFFLRIFCETRHSLLDFVIFNTSEVRLLGWVRLG
jgi:hypothetical protein